MKEDFELKQYDFCTKSLAEINEKYINWPIVYLLNNNKKIYIGETSNVKDRMKQHLNSKEKDFLKTIHIVFDNMFNKSAILDIEQSLIRMFYADTRFDSDKGILNKNNGQSSKHNYYQRELYLNKLENIWDKLRDEKLVNEPYNKIINSDFYKFSPFISLTNEQEEIICKIINNILDNLEGKSKNTTSIITGLAGTGKTILAINLIYNLFNADFSSIDTYKDEGETEKLSEFQKTIHRLRTYTLLNEPIKICFIVPMTSLRKTLKKVLRKINKNLSKVVIGPGDIIKNDYDVIICDEAHRLTQYKNIANMGDFKKKCKELKLDEKKSTQLDWIEMKAKYKVLFYDGNQTIKGADIPKSRMDKLIHENSDKIYNLTTQLRCKSGDLFLEDIEKLFNCSLKRKMRSTKDFEIKIFDNPNEMIKRIKELDRDMKLCRTVAGFDWEWKSNPKSSKNKGKSKEELKKIYDIELYGKRYKWNHTTEGWILSADAVNEIGCVHTVQGYDLNYVGVIIGKDLSYNKEKNEIETHIKELKDKNVKRGTDENEVRNYIINTYRVLLSRGIKGCYIYAHDKSMQDYLKKYIELYDKEECK